MRRNAAAKRPGLTLMELVVVMLILVALAGIVVPMMPSMLTRAHTSTCATNMGELCRKIGEYQVMYGQQPYDFDALTDGTSLINYLAGSGQVVNGVPWPPGQGNGMANGEVTVYTLTGSGALNSSGVTDVAMLTGVGITSVQPMVATAGTPSGWALNPIGTVFDPTFNYYKNGPNTGAPNSGGSIASGSGLAIASGVALAQLDMTPGSAGAARAASLNLSPTGTYILLGVGQRCSLVGSRGVMQTAPVHFGDQPALNPEYGYQHMVAIYQIADSSSSVTMTQARLVGVCPIHDTGLGNIQDELQNAYQLQTGGS